jgi:Ni/Fe-hydrogenase 1 B-type cytochrome subunit
MSKSIPANAVYVYELPVRAWHWINALSVVVLSVTGWLIASPLSSTSGEASANFLMGYVRFFHFAAGYVLAIGLLARAYWALVGNEYARELFYLPVWRGDWWAGVIHELRWYLFLEKQPAKYLGHNPVARTFMFLILLPSTVVMIVTGFALYGEGAQAGSWSNDMFTSWVMPLFGSSQAVHSWHHLVFWAIVTFVILHVYAAVREELVSKQSMIGTIKDGYRVFRD